MRAALVMAALLLGTCNTGEVDTFTVDTFEVVADTFSIDAQRDAFNPACGPCSDGDECTDDLCVDGRCVFVGTLVDRACITDTHCDDGDPCTTDACEDFRSCGFKRCRNRALACDDGDACTYDLCADDGCAAVPADLWAGCQSPDDCDDGNACTRDVCVPIDGCARSRCEYTFIDNCGGGCDVDADCPRRCREVSCQAGQCVQGEAIPGCTQRCDWGPSEPADAVLYGSTVRGFAAAVDCDDCSCAPALELAGDAARLELFDSATLRPMGACEGETCSAMTCAPLALGRGYVIQTNGGMTGTHGFVRLHMSDYCVATHSELMVGEWLGVLAVEDEVARFDAWVEPVHDDDNVTRMVVGGTTSGLLVPAQTVLLPDGSAFLDMSIVTGLGTFSGTLYASRDGLHGNLEDTAGRVGHMSFFVP